MGRGIASAYRGFSYIGSFRGGVINKFTVESDGSVTFYEVVGGRDYFIDTYDKEIILGISNMAEI